MIHTKTVQVPATTKVVEDKVTCDLCHSIIFERVGFLRSTVTVSYEQGEHYPGCNTVETLECDICPTCFTKALVPWLESQGVVMRKTDTGY